MEWLQDLGALPVTDEDDFHAFWNVWDSHHSRVEALSIAPEDQDWVENHVTWFRDLADRRGYYRPTDEVPPQSGTSRKN